MRLIATCAIALPFVFFLGAAVAQTPPTKQPPKLPQKSARAADDESAKKAQERADQLQAEWDKKSAKAMKSICGNC